MHGADRIPTYFSHSYYPDDRAINEYFWDLFWEHGFAFTVDPRTGPLSTTHLELMMRRSVGYRLTKEHNQEAARRLAANFGRG